MYIERNLNGSMYKIIKNDLEEPLIHMRLEDFPVIKEIWRNYNLGKTQTILMINQIDQETPILPRFKEASDFHSFLGKCCVGSMTQEIWPKVALIKVDAVKTDYLDKFLSSTQNLLNQFHQRYS